MPKVFVCSLDDGMGSIEFLPSFFEFLCASFYIKIVNKQYNVMKENLFTNTLKVIGVYYIIFAILMWILGLLSINDECTFLSLAFGIAGVALYIIAWVIHFVCKKVW